VPSVETPSISIFLTFENNAEEAMTFYLSLFDDAKVIHVIRAQPGEPGWAADTLQHAIFSFGGQRFMAINAPPAGARGSDHGPWHEFGFTPAIALYVQCGSEDEIQRLYSALSEKGEVFMPLGDYGFSRQFAWVNDRFGVSWRLNLSADPPQ
jgi:predicted 3-demethylubiquinone-9 3-methyltransferase (glyoxalase superfamily)